MSHIDWRSIESKWQERWDHSAERDSRPKRLITVAYPYPNSPQHIGHGRTYTITDVHARFSRMRGYNVLFPMAFHYTGTPILGMSSRVASGEPELIESLHKLYGVPYSTIETFADPVKIADYFHEEIKSGMREMGYSIDWRREFTTIDPVYKRFVAWQIKTLRKKGLIIQGSHPVGWCPRDQNPVSQHDTKGDVEPGFTEYVLVLFGMGEWTIPAATLRPETVFGATNLWVNPDTTYLRVMVNGQKWLVSPECADKLAHLEFEVERLGEMPGTELVGRDAIIHGRTVPVLPARFVESGTGTGIVMSVPAHAPFDYVALQELQRAGGAAHVKPITIIRTKGLEGVPARTICEEMGITTQDDRNLEEATKLLYEREFYGGVLEAGGFSGPVSDMKQGVISWLDKNGIGGRMTELDSAVFCRCGAACVVKMLRNQWFLNYGDAKWKAAARDCLGKMEVLPPEIRGEFEYTIGWLRERACARQRGLGTELPWDRDWIIESLSDSVIYMAYYIISKFVNMGTVPENVDDSFFDYVLLGNGEPPFPAAEGIRKEFLYYYPVDARHSGRDLVPNHLTFFVMNHAAIFDKKYWPRGIVVNGSVLMKGAKMSKSMGNIIPLRAAIRDHGADAIRLAIILSAELLQDADFDDRAVRNIQEKLEGVISFDVGGHSSQDTEDAWLAGRLSATIASVTSAMERMRLREALHSILYGLESDIVWYKRRKRARGAAPDLALLHRARILLLSPFAPHTAEEAWERIGGSGLASEQPWPKPYGVDPDPARKEDLLMAITDDIKHITGVTGMTPSKITLYVADAAKQNLYHMILGLVMDGSTNMRDVMGRLVTTSEYAKQNPALVQKTLKDILATPVHVRQARLDAGPFDERTFLALDLPALAKSEFNLDTAVYGEGDAGISDPMKKAAHSRPYKPAILLE